MFPRYQQKLTFDKSLETFLFEFILLGYKDSLGTFLSKLMHFNFRESFFFKRKQKLYLSYLYIHINKTYYL